MPKCCLHARRCSWCPDHVRIAHSRPPIPGCRALCMRSIRQVVAAASGAMCSLYLKGLPIRSACSMAFLGSSHWLSMLSLSCSCASAHACAIAHTSAHTIDEDWTAASQMRHYEKTQSGKLTEQSTDEGAGGTSKASRQRDTCACRRETPPLVSCGRRADGEGQLNFSLGSVAEEAQAAITSSSEVEFSVVREDRSRKDVAVAIVCLPAGTILQEEELPGGAAAVRVAPPAHVHCDRCLHCKFTRTWAAPMWKWDLSQWTTLRGFILCVPRYKFGVAHV